MNVLHIVAGSLNEGAARGAYWLHQGLLELRISSHILTTSRETFGDKTVTTIAADKIGKLTDLLRMEADTLTANLYRHRQRASFSTGFFGYDFTRTVEYKKADIIHLHWVCGGMINVRHLAKVKKPLIWTMRDMWPMTGGCHYSMGCGNYKEGCGRCPQLRSKNRKDLSRLVNWRKKKYFPNHMKIVGISNWLSECAKKSSLFATYDVRTIHNNLNTKQFFPIEKSHARRILGLSKDRPIVLVGAQDIGLFYKGFDAYLESIKFLSSDILLLFFGRLDQTLTDVLNHDFVNLGFLYDNISLRIAYCAADVFVAPSRMDAFGKTLAEAMACGTPVVCFDAAGPQDIVDHKQNGYKAKPFEAEDLARGIEWVIEEMETNSKDSGRKEQNSKCAKMVDSGCEYLTDIGRKAREKVIYKFDLNVIAGEYMQLYEDILTYKNVITKHDRKWIKKEGPNYSNVR